MKVKELLEKLKKIDGELEVIIQKDSEGNGYSPLYKIWKGFYVADSSYSGEGYSEEDFEDEYELDYIKEEGKKAIFLHPTN